MVLKKDRRREAGKLVLKKERRREVGEAGAEEG